MFASSAPHSRSLFILNIYGLKSIRRNKTPPLFRTARHASPLHTPPSLRRPPPRPKNTIFLLAGQSNMSGRGGVTGNRWDHFIPPECQPSPDILRLSAGLRWKEAREPLHADIDSRKVCGVGPGMPLLTLSCAGAAAPPLAPQCRRRRRGTLRYVSGPRRETRYTQLGAACTCRGGGGGRRKGGGCVVSGGERTVSKADAEANREKDGDL
ncbi:putative carbohydrate esterase [Dendrobium catenatum]|uniref:Putative carbohydrate esterase n=1 Tax=Dendrobium catenatum TaxID=906689 RepID=A0A2I0WRQ7_9ASPA|nr:putative carbohydrate esterase [Dendrobium catenatum]